MNTKSNPETTRAISNILSSLAASAEKRSRMTKDDGSASERSSVMRTTYSFLYYEDIMRPVYFPLLMLLASWPIEIEDRTTFLWIAYVSTLILMSLSFFLRLREYKQIEFNGNEILFRYTFLPDRVRHLDDYDGYVFVDLGMNVCYVYLVKDHKRVETIAIRSYKENVCREFARRGMKDLGYLDTRKLWFFSHHFNFKRYEY
ncbi:MAG: hypothetical protein J6X31_03100 [Bacteroidales bacterium]|nr:hypothetical protein [Bacteroidales bacterium]